MTLRGRFAPSPSGRLHLGNARSALLGWLDVRARGGEFLLRVEDLDPERCRPEAVGPLLEDLAWLGLDFDGEVVHQSRRGAVYREALDRLEAAGRVYPCWCSRAEVARAATAPHPGEDGPVYPGTCRRGATQRPGRAPAWRFLARPGPTTFVDRLQGPRSQDVAAAVGDFVVRRVDGVASYQLAVVVDDASQGVTDVLRADDLLGSTGRQLQLLEALGATRPAYAHVPLLLGPDGSRLAKRTGALTLGALRQRGVRPEAVVGVLAASSGLGDGAPVAARELMAGFRLEAVDRTPATLTAARLAALGWA